MNEITRIHIAKKAYDIEVPAKKMLTEYISQLERYAEDQDWLQDIEIRITELLEEQGVAVGGVVTTENIQAIKQRLGDPTDFIDQDDVVAEPAVVGPRRLYRDVDTAILGGVLSGVAKYLGFNPVLVRLVALVLMVMSFGTAVVVYLVMWLVVPPARTAAEKLQLEGKPVTLASMKSLREQIDVGDATRRAAPVAQNILVYGTGLLAAMAALGSLIATAWAAFGLLFGTSANSPLGEYVPNAGASWAAYVLFVVSGLLLTALFSVVAYSLLNKSFTKRIAVAAIAIILTGTATFSTGVGAVLYSDWQRSSELHNSAFTKTVDLPKDFTDIDSLVIDDSDSNIVGSFPIEYIVSSDAPRYELTLDAATRQSTVVVDYSDSDQAATVNIDIKNVEPRFYAQATGLKIYGPALGNLTVESGGVTYHNPGQQSALSLSVAAGSVDVSGSYDKLTAFAAQEATVGLTGASIDSLVADMTGGYLSAGVVRTLDVTQPDVCPAQDGYDRQNHLVVEAVSSGQMRYNSESMTAEDLDNPCGELVIGDEDDYDEQTID